MENKGPGGKEEERRFDPKKVFDAFYEQFAESFLEEDREVRRSGPRFPVREGEDPIFVSIGAYRDDGLPRTLHDLFARADYPEKVRGSLGCKSRGESA